MKINTVMGVRSGANIRLQRALHQQRAAHRANERHQNIELLLGRVYHTYGE